MSKVTKFAKYVCDHLTDFELIRDLIVLQPTEHIVRGFSFDRSSTKDCYYILRIIVPLFSPVMPNLSLNYSERISIDGRGDSLVKIQKTECDDREKLLEILKFEHIPFLRNLSGAEDFIRYCSGINMIRPNMKLEFALAHCIVGNFSLGKSLLFEVIEVITPVIAEEPFFFSVRNQAQRVLDAVEAGGSELYSLIQEFENENMQKHFPQLTRLFRTKSNGGR